MEGSVYPFFKFEPIRFYLNEEKTMIHLYFKRQSLAKMVHIMMHRPMNNSFLYLSLFAVLTFTGCDKPDVSVAVPKCIETKIKAIENGPVSNPPKEVWLWEYNGVKYYYFTAACCDQFSELYDANCNLVCAPDGGITGGGDGNCVPGIQSATKTFIWKDPR